MSQYGVDYLQRLRAAVEKFEEAFDRLDEHSG